MHAWPVTLSSLSGVLSRTDPFHLPITHQQSHSNPVSSATLALMNLPYSFFATFPPPPAPPTTLSATTVVTLAALCVASRQVVRVIVGIGQVQHLHHWGAGLLREGQERKEMSVLWSEELYSMCIYICIGYLFVYLEPSLLCFLQGMPPW